MYHGVVEQELRKRHMETLELKDRLERLMGHFNALAGSYARMVNDPNLEDVLVDMAGDPMSVEAEAVEMLRWLEMIRDENFERVLSNLDALALRAEKVADKLL